MTISELWIIIYQWNWTSNNKIRSPGNIEKWLLGPDAHTDKCHTPTSLYKAL